MSSLTAEQKKAWEILSDPFLNTLKDEPMLAGAMYMNPLNNDIYVCNGKEWTKVVGKMPDNIETEI